MTRTVENDPAMNSITHNVAQLDLATGSLPPPPNYSPDDFEHVSRLSSPTPTSMTSPPSARSFDSSTEEKKAKLIYCKSHVAIHPTQLARDNISGLLGIVEVDREVPRVPDAGSGVSGVIPQQTSNKEILIVWVPDELLQRMSVEDRLSYERVEGRKSGVPAEEDGFVFVSVPAPRGEKYAFSHPVSGIYSILVYPPSLTHWYGSATFNLLGGVSLPTLFFHDDQTPLVTTPRTSDPPTPRWGFPPFLDVLGAHSSLIRSRLVTATANRGGELWLVNPSKSDREVHEAGYDEPVRPLRTDSGTTIAGAHAPQTRSTPYPPKQQYPPIPSAVPPSPRDSLLVGLSNITNFSRRAAQNVLSHPLAKPVVPHLPPAVRSLVNAPGEWERAHLIPPKKSGVRGQDVASEFESARLYLARWARVVAEEGERARRDEVAASAGTRRSIDIASGASGEDLLSSLGVFSLLPRNASKRPVPTPTRTPQHPITAREWDSFVTQGRDEQFIRGEIFRRGFTDGPETDEIRARREGWEVLLGILPWSLGGIGGGEGARQRRRDARQQAREAKRAEYEVLLNSWRAKARGGESPDSWKEEWHRIDVDARRTDRTQPIYAFTPEVAKRGDEEKEGGGASTSNSGWGENDKEEEGGQAGLNPHIAALRTILMTYHVYAPELGYVQGMSDLLSPIYYVFGANEADAFWALVGVMGMMESNFLRDQSGMKRQLSTLQQLIGLMDPELYAHLERTESLNLFFCFRWILIAFKREFKFEQIIKLWEVLWTNYYSNQFVLFVALGVLQSHRDVIIRYLTEFDEVLKYANDLSGTIDLDTTLAQAEVLFISFRSVIEEIDKENTDAIAIIEEQTLRRRRVSEGSTHAAASPVKIVNGVEVREPRSKPEPPARTVSDDLRELLEAWQPKGKGREVESET